MRFDNFISVELMLAAMVAGIIIWGAVLAWQWWRTMTEASDIYAAKREIGELRPHVRLEDFKTVYIAAEAPVKGTHLFAAAATSMAAMPLGIWFFSALWYEIWLLAGRVEVAANGTMIHTFATFVFIMAIMIGVLYWTLKRYYENLPPSLSAGMRQLNAGAEPGAAE
ncbi:MAG: hypothetical protein AAFO57_01245 [Pseudomonadota bacterium]